MQIVNKLFTYNTKQHLELESLFIYFVHINKKITKQMKWLLPTTSEPSVWMCDWQPKGQLWEHLQEIQKTVTHKSYAFLKKIKQ